MAKLHAFQITCLAVLVRGIIRNTDLLAMILFLISCALEHDDLVRRDPFPEAIYPGITVNMHRFGKERVIECIFRIILDDISFRHKYIGCKVQEQTAVSANQCVDRLIKFVFLRDLTDNNKCSDPETSACFWQLILFREIIWKESKEISVRIHHGIITRVSLTYRSIFSLAILLL